MKHGDIIARITHLCPSVTPTSEDIYIIIDFEEKPPQTFYEYLAYALFHHFIEAYHVDYRDVLKIDNTAKGRE